MRYRAMCGYALLHHIISDGIYVHSNGTEMVSYTMLHLTPFSAKLIFFQKSTHRPEHVRQVRGQASLQLLETLKRKEAPREQAPPMNLRRAT